MEDNIDVINHDLKKMIDEEIKGMTFPKNFRSPTAEKWYVFLPSYKDLVTGVAAGKTIIHYNLYDTKQIFINTTIIFDDSKLHENQLYQTVYVIVDEIVNRLVGYADTLLSVH